MQDDQQPIEQQTSEQPVVVPAPPTPPISQDEAMLRDATAAMAENSEPSPSPSYTQVSKPKRGKKFALILIVLAIVAGAGVAVWQLGGKRTGNSNKDNSAATQTVSSTATAKASTVAYAFRATDKDSYVVYSRPAAGGERTEALKLDKNAVPINSDVRGQTVVFSATDGLYLSSDAGKSYKQVVKLPAGQQVTSVRVSVDSTKIAYGFLDQAAGKNVVKQISLDGSGSKDLFTATSAGVFIYAWDAAKQKMVYGEGCYDCDGAVTKYFSRDLKSDSVKVLDIIKDKQSIQSLVVSDDMSQFTYVSGGQTSGALGSIVAPYEISQVEVATSKTTPVTTIGEKGEKNPNGTDKVRRIFIRYENGTTNLYYGDDLKLSQYQKGTSSVTLAFTADAPLQSLVYVSAKYIVAGTGKASSDYSLDNYGVADKKTTQIFQGDNNAIVFGVTEK